MSIVDILGSNQVSGDFIDIKRTNKMHLNEKGVMADFPGKAGGVSFEEMILEAMGNVNDDQMNSASLMEQMITNPDSVDTHDVTISMAKADMSLNVTKAVIDRAVKAYKEITSLR